MKTVIMICACALAFSGCAAYGPSTVPRDGFDYTSAISDSWKQQMLFNIVKIRYGDAPVFLDVASVINQYSVESQVNLLFGWAYPVVAGGTNVQSVGGAARYVDRPTITYSPITGQKFARSLMTPIPPTAVLSLIQAGYPVDLILRISVHTINGIRNRFGGSARARSADPEFYPLLERLRRIQDSGGIGMRFEKKNEMEGVIFTFRGKVSEETNKDSLWVRKTLGLKPDADTFKVVYGSVAKDDREIAIQTRSVLEILVDLSSLIDVPEKHVAEKVVNPTMVEQVADGSAPPPLLRIHSSSARPGNAFIAIPYQGYWFYIDNRDYASKRLFSFIMFIFALTETGGGKEEAPIVTIPVGG
ncbi:MAG TPA: hypothetical protein VFG19_05700 [Geobacteraceae bacterium]|nr:hypothetical protein [Geobacteraceae bacterium]